MPIFAIVAIAAVFAANIFLLLWIGADFKTIAGSATIQIIWTFAGALLITRYRLWFRDPVLFFLSGWVAGLAVFMFSGLIWMHRALLGETPHLAAMASLAPLALMALIELIRIIRKSPAMDAVKWNSVAILLLVSFIVASTATYGFGNNEKRIQISDPAWRQQEGLVPVWAWQGDRRVHYNKNVVPLFRNGLPPKRINHRGFHVVQLFVTLLTGEMTKARTMIAYKTMSLIFFFVLAYGLYFMGRLVWELGEKTAIMVGATALFFSPLKLPIFELSPTYRGFFTASGSLYHSDTQYTSVACGSLGILLVLIHLKNRHPLFFPGCALIAGSFFLKPSVFMVAAPAAYLVVALDWRNFDRDRFFGLLILLGIPLLWFGYIYLSDTSSNFDGVLQRPNPNIRRTANMSLSLHFFAGYLTRLEGRFPQWIEQSAVLTAIAMTLLSFTAFWVGAYTALQKLLGSLRQGLGAFIAHIQQNQHIYFQLTLFVLAISTAVLLAEHKGNNINWKWAASAAYIMCLPLFVKGITLVPWPWLRITSWGLYGVQTALGIGYLYYLFWYSKLF